MRPPLDGTSRLVAMTSRRLASTTAAVCLISTGIGVAFVLASAGVATPTTSASRAASTFQALAFLPLAPLGALVARRQPRHPAGWLLLTIGLSIALWIAADGWALQSLVVAPGTWGGARAVWGAWLANWIWVIGWAATAFLFLLFPDGRLPGGRGRAALPAGIAASLLALAALALPAGPLEKYPWLANPIGGLPVPGGGAAAADLGVIPLVAFGAAAILRLLLRLRYAYGIERRQMALIAFAAAIVVGLVGLGVAVDALGWRDRRLEVLVLVSTALLPISAALGVLRYRLWDVGLVVRRTVVYTTLSVILAATFAATAVVVGIVLQPLTTDSWPATVLSTLVVTSITGPLRRRLQRSVERRFDRQRYDAVRLVDEYRQRLRTEVDLGVVLHGLAATAQASLRPRSVGVWVPGGAGPRSSPEGGAGGGRA